MTAPDRIWYNGHTQHMRELRHSPPTSNAHPQVEYIRAALDTPAPAPDVAGLVTALKNIDALDPEQHIDGCSASVLRGLVLRMGEIARAALATMEEARNG